MRSTFVLQRVFVYFMLALSATSTLASEWPNRPIHIVVPYPPGGGGDIITRGVGEALTKRFGQPVVVDNKAGATGAIGALAVARAPADGYTFLLTQVGPGVTAPLTQKGIAYDAIRDFTPIVLVGQTPVALFVAMSSAFSTVDDVVKYARANPNKLDYGTPGVATPAHLAGELFQRVSGTRINHIPYKGSASTPPALLGGQVAMVFDTLPPHIPLVKGGKTRALAVASAVRSNSLPDVVTMKEAGLGALEMSSWYAYAGPAGLPRAIVDAFNTAANVYIKSVEGSKRLDDIGLLPQRGGTPEEFAAFLKAEVAKLEPIIRAANITTD